jgi:hypothetical protein
MMRFSVRDLARPLLLGRKRTPHVIAPDGMNSRIADSMQIDSISLGVSTFTQRKTADHSNDIALCSDSLRDSVAADRSRFPAFVPVHEAGTRRPFSV